MQFLTWAVKAKKRMYLLIRFRSLEIRPRPCNYKNQNSIIFQAKNLHIFKVRSKTWRDIHRVKPNFGGSDHHIEGLNYGTNYTGWHIETEKWEKTFLLV